MAQKRKKEEIKRGNQARVGENVDRLAREKRQKNSQNQAGLYQMLKRMGLLVPANKHCFST